jgi:hypothetical protein
LKKCHFSGPPPKIKKFWKFTTGLNAYFLKYLSVCLAKNVTDQLKYHKYEIKYDKNNDIISNNLGFSSFYVVYFNFW